jgi:large subunit ribosomal protein L25
MVSHQDFVKFLHAREGEHGLLTLRVEGAFEHPVLIKDIQQDPVDGEITHLDFHVIVLTEQIRIKIPLVLKGEPIGVKEEGGVLEHFLREVEIECLPTQIPKQIEHDISQLTVGAAIHVRDLIAPAGVRLTTDVGSVIASVLARKEEKAEEVAEAITEPEVIREKKPEVGAEAAAAEETPEKKEKEEKQ